MHYLLDCFSQHLSDITVITILTQLCTNFSITKYKCTGLPRVNNISDVVKHFTRQF
jgi:hypothetical protein